MKYQLTGRVVIAVVVVVVVVVVVLVVYRHRTLLVCSSSIEPPLIPTAQASSFRIQYFLIMYDVTRTCINIQ